MATKLLKNVIQNSTASKVVLELVFMAQKEAKIATRKKYFWFLANHPIVHGWGVSRARVTVAVGVSGI